MLRRIQLLYYDFEMTLKSDVWNQSMFSWKIILFVLNFIWTYSTVEKNFCISCISTFSGIYFTGIHFDNWDYDLL